LAKVLNKDALQNKLYCGQQLAIELLYSRYGGMLYGYILQFIPDEMKAQSLMVTIFASLTMRLQEACDSNLTIYCWLQIEARKIMLSVPPEPTPFTSASVQGKATYLSLLEDASPEHQKIFSKLFLDGRPKEDLALQTGKDPAYIDRVLKECLLIIRKKLG